jgi:hypothetical protein
MQYTGMQPGNVQEGFATKSNFMENKSSYVNNQSQRHRRVYALAQSADRSQAKTKWNDNTSLMDMTTAGTTLNMSA